MLKVALKVWRLARIESSWVADANCRYGLRAHLMWISRSSASRSLGPSDLKALNMFFLSAVA